LKKLSTLAEVAVGDMAAQSHPCDRDIRTSICSRYRRRALRDDFL